MRLLCSSWERVHLQRGRRSCFRVSSAARGDARAAAARRAASHPLYADATGFGGQHVSFTRLRVSCAILTNLPTSCRSTSVAVQPRLAAPSTSADPVASTSTSTGPSLISSESDPSYTPSASLQLILQASSALDTTEALSAQDVDGLDASAGGDDYSHYARDSLGLVFMCCAPQPPSELTRLLLALPTFSALVGSFRNLR